MDRLQQRLLAAVGLLLVVTVVGMAVLWPPAFEPPEDAPDPGDLVSGRVVAVEEYVFEGEEDFVVPGRSALIDVELLGGEDVGEVVTIDTLLDGYPDIEVGDRVRMVRVTFGEGPDREVEYGIADFERGRSLALLVGLFVVVVIAIGGLHGLRSLLGLGLSLFVVAGFVVPAILAGSSPFAVAFFGALAVMLVTLPLSHGVNTMTAAAVVGTTAALVLTTVLGVLFIDLTSLTGFTSEEANLARFAVEGLDPKGLVLAGMIIAALGVLDDVTVSQASTVFALRGANTSLGWAGLFRRAMGVGRDHIASTVNTLVLAYAGASLALLVLFSTSGVSVVELVASEVIAEEVVKTLVGSIGLISAVPLTTALAASLAVRTDPAALPAAHAHGHGGPSARPAGGRSVPDPNDRGESGGEQSKEKDYDAWLDFLKHGAPDGREPPSAGSDDEPQG